MTIKLRVTVPPPAPGEGKAVVNTIGLPDELEAGIDIIGSIEIMNVGDASTQLRGLVTTMWDNRELSAESGVGVGVGGIFTINIPSGLIVMPTQDAIIEIKGQHKNPAGDWITDDTKSH